MGILPKFKSLVHHWRVFFFSEYHIYCTILFWCAFDAFYFTFSKKISVPDSNLRYHLIGAGGGRIPFGVRTDSGTIFVKEPLDFESSDQYHLILIASDGRHNATTNVYIHIEDVNDNAPQFEQLKYATTVIEEDVDVPKVLFNVRATDADQDEKSSRIVYRLEGQGADEVFRIGKYSGTIELVRPLDRDPPTGVPSWNFVVQAIDDDGNGLVGYADVQVRITVVNDDTVVFEFHVNVSDINDNSPIFPERLYGFIEENREPIREFFSSDCLVAPDRSYNCALPKCP